MSKAIPEALPAPESQTEPEAKEDDSYFELSEHLVIGQGTPNEKTLDKLLINPSKLKGADFFQIVEAFKTQFPASARANFVKYNDENYLALVIGRLNGITPEDLYKVPYCDLPSLFLRAGGFQFSAPAVKKT
jgi:hypothetical protein